MENQTTTTVDLRPKKRSSIRLKLGKLYYKTRRYLRWYCGRTKYSKVVNGPVSDFRYLYTSHQTPLIRQLKDVEMYLQYNKITNLKLAIEKLNHMIIYPGETFSYWKSIGKPTKRKGYKDGMVLFYGSFQPGTGGGLCQLSNLIYWMAIHTPLTVTERYRHSFDVFPDSNRTQPFGSGATCIYNYRDLMIKNETNQPFLLSLEVTSTDLIGSFYSNVFPSYTYQVYEQEHHMDREYWGGYSRHNTLYRKVYDLNGKEVADEYLTENHALMMYSPFIAEKEA